MVPLYKSLIFFIILSVSSHQFLLSGVLFVPEMSYCFALHYWDYPHCFGLVPVANNILYCFPWYKVIHILHKTMVYADSIHTSIDYLGWRFDILYNAYQALFMSLLSFYALSWPAAHLASWDYIFPRQTSVLFFNTASFALTFGTTS